MWLQWNLLKKWIKSLKMNIQQSVLRQTGLLIPENTPLGNPLKTAIQEAVFNQCKEDYIILDWATGTSKTRAALLHCENKIVHFSCKQDKHKQTWLDEISQWNLNPAEFTTGCHKSIDKYTNKYYDVVVIDEGHGVTDRMIPIIKNMNYGKLIIVSGTFPQHVYSRLYKIGKPRIIKIPVSKAIEWKLIPSPKINVVEVPLDNTIRNLIYRRHQARFKTTQTIQYNQWNIYKTKFMNLDVLCTQKEYYDILEDEFVTARKLFFEQPDYRNKPEMMCQQTQFFYNSFLQKGGMRKKFLGIIRTPIVQRLMKKLEGQRLVVFSNDINQCNILGQGYPVVHSKSKDKEVIEQFNNYELDKLFSVKQLDESMNLEGEFSAIIVSLGGSTIQSVQRLGRSLRSENSEIFIFHTPNTRDDHYLKEFKQGLDDSFFTYLKLDDL